MRMTWKMNVVTSHFSELRRIGCVFIAVFGAVFVGVFVGVFIALFGAVFGAVFIAVHSICCIAVFGGLFRWPTW